MHVVIHSIMQVQSVRQCRVRLCEFTCRPAGSHVYYKERDGWELESGYRNCIFSLAIALSCACGQVTEASN